jgi:hypothetical protein
MSEKQRVEIDWVDARSDDGWTEQSDLDVRTAAITTLGRVAEETEEVLCIASSIEKHTGQLSGIMFIPKPCIITRQIIPEPLRQMAPEDTAHLPSFGSRIGPLELRHLSGAQPEIVFWTPTKAPGGAPFCHVLAHWTRYLDRPGEWYLSFCGARPLAPEVNRKDFLRLAETGQNWLKENRPEA